MTKEEYWFAVGFIAGEGYIGCSPSLKISVNQTEEKPLILLQSIFGGTISGPIDRGNPKHSPRWDWCSTGSRAAGIIMTLIPGLKKVHEHKYTQAIEAIIQWKTLKLPAGKRTHCPQGHEYTTINIVGNYTSRPGRQCLICARSRQNVRRVKLQSITKEQV